MFVVDQGRRLKSHTEAQAVFDCVCEFVPVLTLFTLQTRLKRFPNKGIVLKIQQTVALRDGLCVR